MPPLILLTNVREGVRPKAIVQAFLSFGLPRLLHRGKGWWAIESKAVTDAQDAVWVVNRHMGRLRPILGPDLRVAYAEQLPEGPRTARAVEGKVFQ